MVNNRRTDSGMRHGSFSIVVTILIISVIWLHSLMSGEASHAESSWVVEFLKPYVAKFYSGQVTDHIVRKAAHFIEYAVLGASLALVSYRFVKRFMVRIFVVMLMGAAVASIDEYIQSFSDRNAQLSDVLLDSSGVLAGCVFIMLLCALVRKLR